ncbi:MAG: hypothetical protein COB62_07735, partial [Piscirickettsiaceae bacterium]
WELVNIEYVQKKISLKSNEATTWYLGAFNIDLDSLVFNATVAKKKAVDDVDYYFNADGGNIEIVNALDESSDLSMSFNYRPGPQYQAGDVSLNTVSFIDDTILIAGEFGTVIVLGKDGKWTSIYEDVRLDDSSMPYWMESTVVGQSIALVGAGGVVTVSHDRGKTWLKQDMKGDNGLFDVAFMNNKDLMVAGSVGTVAINHANTWTIANRTGLDLIAWLKTIVSMGGDKYIVAGGRGTLVSYQNKTWNKITIREAVK